MKSVSECRVPMSCRESYEAFKVPLCVPLYINLSRSNGDARLPRSLALAL